ncbi:type II secretion system minor pseudopilin GspI [Emcibacter sp.]|uniref:type II secretion system minor pseudopilin GspI n=1 Tax=Emcibacter sp. TaxID=1979954 RepID=UPI002AA7086A|nr:type II secretion system minor pseudopilin GspI [Emcibacter sp.]
MARSLSPELPDTHGESGFSLVEIMVALFVFSIAALALVKMGGENIRNLSLIEQRTLAGIVAENQLALTVAKKGEIRPGVQTGSEQQDGIDFDWQVQIRPAPDPKIYEVRVRVLDRENRQELALLTGYRGRE